MAIFSRICFAVTAGVEHVLIDVLHPGEVNFTYIAFHVKGTGVTWNLMQQWRRTQR